MRLQRDHLVTALMLAAGVVAVASTSAQSVRVTGQVINSAGVGVSGVDLDFGISVPGSTSVIGGFFDFMVPAGKYDIGFIPPSSQLAPRLIPDVEINAELNMGAISLQPGFGVTGTILNRTGAPIPSVDIDVSDLVGDVLYTPDDNSDLTGFFQVVVPAGTYDFRITAPGTTPFVPQEIQQVAVESPTNLGTITMLPGFPVTGRVVHSQSLLPLVNIDLDVEDVISGQKVFTPADDTDALGVFNLFLPIGIYHLSFDPPSGLPLIGRQRFNLLVLGPVDIGDFALEPGFVLSGTVLDPSLLPVVGADIDVARAPDGNRIYTPGDKTNGAGGFSVVVPAGSYRLRIQPPFALGLVGDETPVVVSADTVVPTVNLAQGFVLSGTLTDFVGNPELGADIDVLDPLTGTEIVLSGDDTDAFGHYQVVVPPGTWRVEINTRKLSPSRVETLLGVNVFGPTVRNHMLDLVPVATFLETFGVPGVPQGGLMVVNFAAMNFTVNSLGTLASLVLIDPDGGETFLVAPTLLMIPPQLPFVSLGLPIPVPAVSPQHRGQVFRLEVRFDDALTGLEFDRDNVKFIIR